MSNACTIYCKKADHSVVYEILASLSQVPMEVVGTVEDWQSITVVQQSTIKFNSLRQHAGTFNEFSELILGTHSFFRNVQTDDGVRRDKLLTNISECRLAIGVTGFPEFNEAERHYDMIFDIAKSLNGFIFNGSGMIDENGLMILNSDGSFDED